MTSWTIVSCYFNLRDKVNKPFSFYQEKGQYLFKTDHNIIFFTDKDNYANLWNLRRSYNLLNKTFFVIMELDQFPFYKYKDQIKENRKSNSWYGDWNRNTPEYFILVASKLEMLNQSTLINPFGSSHFIWIDFGIQYLKYVKDGMIESNLSHFRDKFSMCYMRYHSDKFIKNYAEWYKMGQCGTAGGVLSGNKEYITKIYRLFNDKFIELVQNGYGHGEEQIIIELEKDHPSLFEFYYGTYDSILANRIDITEDVDSILRYFIIPCRLDNNHTYAYNACSKIKMSLDAKLITLTTNQLLSYVDEFFISAWYLNKIDICLMIVKYLEDEMKSSINKNEIILEFNKKLDHYTSNFDFILPYVVLEKQVAIYNKEIEYQPNENEKVFIYTSDEINGYYLLTSNPVKRPLSREVKTSYDVILR